MENTRITLSIVFPKKPAFNSIALDVNPVGISIPTLLSGVSSPYIPNPRMIDSNGKRIPLKWSFKSGQLTVDLYGKFDGLTFPVTLYNTTIDVAIGTTTNNDGYLDGTNFIRDYDSIILGDSDGANENAFFRFTGITISAGATITASYLTYTAYQNDTGTTVKTNIYADNAAAPTAPTSAATYNGKTLTTALVAWNSIGSWTANTAYNTPSINDIITELIADNGAYASGVMQFLHKNNASSANAQRQPWDYTGSTTKAAKLHIEWSAAAAGQTPFTRYYPHILAQ